ncbi:uncharacterized protein LOC131671783 [Phymastichus coffea]|uniref:uncharacterized protein LOC131671783 n=1 Tax=Phymastichus coffea TaxID=108790 RepID=UPI00273BDCDE|nr:uncharacterized protein LOC131671783 [Phymastichus coffea]
MVDKFLEAHGIIHGTCAPCSLKSNPTERVNRTIKTMIVTFVEKHTRWDELIHEHAFAYDTTIHESTYSSPAFLNYGRHPELPRNARRKEEHAALEQLEAVARNAWHSRMSKLDDFRANALENSKTAQARVLTKNRVLSSATKAIAAKLCPKYAGPFIITACLGMNSYQLQTKKGVDIKKVAVTDLKPEEYSRDDENLLASEIEKLSDEEIETLAEQSTAYESMTGNPTIPMAGPAIQRNTSNALPTQETS